MSRRPLGSLNGALLGRWLLLGLLACGLLNACGGSDALRVGIYDPATASYGYGYGGASAGASAWSGYAGVAPTVASASVTNGIVVPTVVLHVPRLQYGVITPLEPASFPPGSMRLSTPALHTRRSDGWHYR